MYVCAIFGDDDFSEKTEEKLRETIIDLIKREGVHYFFVGQDGLFNSLVRMILWELESRYYDFNYEVVLSHLYLTEDPPLYIMEKDSYATIPPELSFAYRPDSVDKRDAYIIGESDFVLVYTAATDSRAEKSLELAQRKKKKIVHLKE